MDCLLRLTASLSTVSGESLSHRLPPENVCGDAGDWAWDVAPVCAVPTEPSLLPISPCFVFATIPLGWQGIDWNAKSSCTSASPEQQESLPGRQAQRTSDIPEYKPKTNIFEIFSCSTRMVSWFTQSLSLTVVKSHTLSAPAHYSWLLSELLLGVPGLLR